MKQTVMMDVSMSEGPTISSERNGMRVKFRQIEDSVECHFPTHPSTPLQGMLQHYANQRGVPATALRFILDGEEVDASETPQDLALEEDDVILVGHRQGTWITAGAPPGYFANPVQSHDKKMEESDPSIWVEDF